MHFFWDIDEYSVYVQEYVPSICVSYSKSSLFTVAITRLIPKLWELYHGCSFQPILILPILPRKMLSPKESISLTPAFSPHPQGSPHFPTRKRRAPLSRNATLTIGTADGLEQFHIRDRNIFATRYLHVSHEKKSWLVWLDRGLYYPAI